MTASDHKFIRITQKSLFQSSRLLSALAAVGLLGTQGAMAQNEGSAVDLTIPAASPAPEVSIPATPATPAVPAPVAAPAAPAPPVVVEPAAPAAPPVEIVAPEPAAPSPVVIELPSQQDTPTLESLLERSPGNSEVPEVDVVSPLDYGTAQVDPTDYSVGATMPNVVISERSSGCEFSLQSGSKVANAACRQVERLTAAVSGNGTSTLPSQAVRIPGLQAVTGITTAASREYYNQAAKAVVKLQLGQKFIFPLSMPASLTSLFGWRMHPIFGVQRFHAGTDLGAPLGTPVVATQSGRVTLSDVAGGYGLMVVLRHNNDTLESRYAHLSRLLVQAGDWVEQGEVIGLVGSTGNSTGPHLHFELRQLTENGWVVLNPDSLLQQTLGTLVQALDGSLTAFAGKGTTIKKEGAEAAVQDTVSELPFRPAQPHAN